MMAITKSSKKVLRLCDLRYQILPNKERIHYRSRLAEELDQIENEFEQRQQKCGSRPEDLGELQEKICEAKNRIFFEINLLRQMRAFDEAN